ncbi:single-stranded DNA binding protein [Squirrelpox virus]|uniref:Protein OPG079 n=1 Tax=Squirrelpox virus TaxID=240426 RepID=U3UBG8_9POXV|nr:single-stranded DNA binding protein [Squirrelpox virus]CCD83221.1 single-stranded DNA binding protein [Squirrelpox virus]
MRKAVSNGKAPAARKPAMASGDQAGDKVRHNCTSVVEHARSISKSNEKCVECVTLTQSQFPSCSNINVTLVPRLAQNLISPLIIVEGETKVFRNKSGDAFNKRGGGDEPSYFIRSRLTSASPMLYQLLEAVYSNIRARIRIPQTLANLDVDAMEERTLRDGFLYLNKMQSAMLELTEAAGPARVMPLQPCLEALTTRDVQMARLVLAPTVLYRSAGDLKISFTLKKLIMARECSVKVVGLDGENVDMVMSDTRDEDVGRGLGVIGATGDDAAGDEEGDEVALFNL